MIDCLDAELSQGPSHQSRMLPAPRPFFQKPTGVIILEGTVTMLTYGLLRVWGYLNFLPHYTQRGSFGILFHNAITLFHKYLDTKKALCYF